VIRLKSVITFSDRRTKHKSVFRAKSIGIREILHVFEPLREREGNGVQNAGEFPAQFRVAFQLHFNGAGKSRTASRAFLQGEVGVSGAIAVEAWVLLDERFEPLKSPT
jgi:hypothetical protein